MRRFPLAVTATVVGSVLAVALAGCGSLGDPAGPGVPDGGPVSASAPGSLIDQDCENLIDGVALQAVFAGNDVPRVAAPRDGLGGLYEATQDGTLQAGALQCSWANGYGAGDHYLDVTVLPNAVDSWSRFEADVKAYQTTKGGWGEASWVECRTSSALGCRVDVLVGTHWVNARGWGIAGEAEFDALLDSLVGTLRGAKTLEPGWANDSAVAPSCDALIGAAALSDAVGGAVQAWQDRPTVIQPVIFQAGFEQAGGVICSWRGDFSASTARTVEVAVLPGGGWAWDVHYGVPARDGATRTEVSDLGDRAMVTLLKQSDRSYGYASVLKDGTWFDVSVNVEGSDADAQIAETIARSIVGG